MQGITLGPYRIGSELGSGGMGKVYLAEAVERCAVPEGTRVALKIVHPHLLAEPGFFKRFLREAEIGRAVRHPNVVRCHDCDQLVVEGATHAFLVMEYVEGQTLRGLLDEMEAVPEELCRHIGREVSRGLAAIHDAGVVHRDLKPENVLITPRHEVKIMDLGVARLADEAIRLSVSGAFVGSALYASPEQFGGEAGDLDGRADLFSLGVILYELSCGAHPHPGDSFMQVLAKVVEEEPRRLGERNPQLSAFFEEVVHALLAKDREQRFASGSMLSEALEEGEESAWWRSRARSLRAETMRPLRRIRIPRETSVYGREDELEWLRSCFVKSKSGVGQVVLIEGEAGIGKSRLVDEFVGRLRQEGEDVNFLFGSYPPGGAATGLGGFSTAFREHFGEGGSGDYLPGTPQLVPAFDALLRGESAPAGAMELTAGSLAACFVKATRSLASERPTILLIDDLHFAPEEARDTFTSLAMAVPGHRVLLIGTARPGVPEEWQANLTRLEHASRHVLERLGPRHLAKLLVDAFASERLAAELGHRIALKSDGNPFFVFEIIRGLREGQFIEKKDDGTWISTRVIEEIEIPSSVLDLVNARVAALTEEERTLLDVAACRGYEFDPGLVGEVLGLPRIPALRSFGHIERKHRLVRACGRMMAFDHHQVQEALYGSLLEQLREEYHAALAEALEARSGAVAASPESLDGALAVDLFEQFMKGARGEAAVRYLDPALTHLLTGHMNGRAVELAETALAAPGLLTGLARAKLLLRLGEAVGPLDKLGRHARQREAAEEAEALAAGEGEDLLRARAAAAVAAACHRRSHFDESENAARRAVEIATATGDRDTVASARGTLGHVARASGRSDEARGHFEAQLAIARELRDRSLEAAAVGNLGNVCQNTARYEEALAHYESALSIDVEVGNAAGQVKHRANAGYALYALGRYEDSRIQSERAVSQSREIGYRVVEAYATGTLGLALARLGHPDTARECFERRLELSREAGSRSGVFSSLLSLGNLLHSQGRFPEARETYAECVRISREIGDRIKEGTATLNMGFVLSSLGRYEDAREEFEIAGAIAEARADRYGRGCYLLNLGSMNLELGAIEPAAEQIEEALEILREIGARREESHTLYYRAELAETVGDRDRAKEICEEALALRRAIDSPSGIAESLVQLGRFLLARGRPEEGRERLREALGLADEKDLLAEAVLASALLGLLPDAVERYREHESRLPHCVRMEALLLLFRATGERAYLEEARCLLDHLVDHAPEEFRETMLLNVPLHREILGAGGEQHPAS